MMFFEGTFWDLAFKILLWCAVIYFLKSIYKQVKPKPSRLQGDTQTRLWTRFQFANAGLFQILDADERKNLVETFKNTVKNAEMYKDPKTRLLTDKGSSPKKRVSKSVKFNNNLDILGPKST